MVWHSGSSNVVNVKNDEEDDDIEITQISDMIPLNIARRLSLQFGYDKQKFSR